MDIGMDMKVIHNGNSSKNRRQPTCSRCRYHGMIEVRVLQHQCPYKSCTCSSCLLVKRRAMMYRSNKSGSSSGRSAGSESFENSLLDEEGEDGSSSLSNEPSSPLFPSNNSTAGSSAIGFSSGDTGNGSSCSNDSMRAQQLHSSSFDSNSSGTSSSYNCNSISGCSSGLPGPSYCSSPWNTSSKSTTPSSSRSLMNNHQASPEPHHHQSQHQHPGFSSTSFPMEGKISDFHSLCMTFPDYSVARLQTIFEQSGCDFQRTIDTILMKKWYEDSRESSGSNSSGQSYHQNGQKHNQLSAQHKTNPGCSSSHQLHSNEYPSSNATRAAAAGNFSYMANSLPPNYYEKPPYSAAVHYGLSNGYSGNSNYYGSGQGYSHQGPIHSPQAQYPYGGHQHRHHYQQHPYHSSHHPHHHSAGHSQTGSYHGTTSSDYYYANPSSLINSNSTAYPFQSTFCESSSSGLLNGGESAQSVSGSIPVNSAIDNTRSDYSVTGFHETGANSANCHEGYSSQPSTSSNTHHVSSTNHETSNTSGNYHQTSSSSSSSFYYPTEEGSKSNNSASAAAASSPSSSLLPPPPPLINSTNMKCDQGSSKDQGQELQSDSESRTTALASRNEISCESGSDKDSSLVGYKYNPQDEPRGRNATEKSRENIE